MNSLEDSALQSLDADDARLLPHLPYILQDLDELGSDPAVVTDLIRRHCSRSSELRVLDLGCGKGAVSLRIARDLGCHCRGVDAIESFITDAREKAAILGLDHMCEFEAGDARTVVVSPPDYDVVVLASIGPVFGDCESTLKAVAPRLRPGGMIILDDCYREDDTDSWRSDSISRTELLRQIDAAGMELRDEVLADRQVIRRTNERMFTRLHQRCMERIESYPEDRDLFERYLLRQREENHMLGYDIICSTMAIALPQATN
jgi:cyclopropane fatty-acyl-phospholipid synthase-like methyltransferase